MPWGGGGGEGEREGEDEDKFASSENVTYHETEKRYYS